MKKVLVFKFTTICKKNVQICWQYQDELKTEKKLSGDMLKNDWNLALHQLHVAHICCGPCLG